MKTSRKIALITSLVNIFAVILGIALFNPLKSITTGPVPVMIYVLVLLAVAVIVCGYALIPKIETLEEKGD